MAIVATITSWYPHSDFAHTPALMGRIPGHILSNGALLIIFACLAILVGYFWLHWIRQYGLLCLFAWLTFGCQAFSISFNPRLLNPTLYGLSRRRLFLKLYCYFIKWWSNILPDWFHVLVVNSSEWGQVRSSLNYNIFRWNVVLNQNNILRR